MEAAIMDCSDWWGRVDDLQAWSSPKTAKTPPFGDVPTRFACFRASTLRSTPGPFPYHIEKTPSCVASKPYSSDRETSWVPAVWARYVSVHSSLSECVKWNKTYPNTKLLLNPRSNRTRNVFRVPVIRRMHVSSPYRHLFSRCSIWDSVGMKSIRRRTTQRRSSISADETRRVHSHFPIQPLSLKHDSHKHLISTRKHFFLPVHIFQLIATSHLSLSPLFRKFENLLESSWMKLSRSWRSSLELCSNYSSSLFEVWSVCVCVCDFQFFLGKKKVQNILYCKSEYIIIIVFLWLFTILFVKIEREIRRVKKWG